MTDRNFIGQVPFKHRLLSPVWWLVVLPNFLFYQLFAGGCLLPANLLKDVYPWRTNNPKDLVPWNVLQFDGITQFYPWRLFASQTWRSGYVPLWNPHQFCGTPFLANGQSATLYPPNLLFLLLPVKDAFGWSAVLHLIFTGVVAYFFFRRAAGCSRWGAAVGATCWQLSTWQISWLALPTFLDTSSWLPAALLAVFYLAKWPTVLRAAILAATIALMVLAGHLQISFYCLLLTVAYGVFLIVTEKIAFGVWMKAVLVAGSIAFLLVAAQILPLVELSRLSVRGATSVTSAGYAAYIALAMPLEQTAALFVPGFFGHPEQGTYWPTTPYPENAGYVGALGLLLAFISLFRNNHQGERIFFVVVAAFALLIAVGSPLNGLFYYGIPGFASTGSPARILVLWTFCIAFLAAKGVDDVLRRESRVWTGTATFLIVGLITIGAVLFEIASRESGYFSFVQNDIRLFVGLLLGALAILWLHARKTISTVAVGPLIFALVATDLLFINFGYNPVVDPSAVYPSTPSIAWLQQHAGNDRVMPINTHWSNISPPDAVLPPNGATVYGLYDMQGYDSLQTKAYRAFANHLNGRGDIPLENGNITFTYVPGTPDSREADGKYLVSLTPLTGFGAPIIANGNVLIYEDTAARPLGGAAVVQQLSPSRLELTPPSRTDTIDLAIQWYPGWKVVNTMPSPTRTKGGELNLSQSGETPFIHVRFAHNDYGKPSPIYLRFQPASFQIGLYLTLIGLSVFSGVCVYSLRRKLQLSHQYN